MLARKTVSLDYGRLVRESRKIRPDDAGSKLRMAILSDAATQQFVPLLRTLFHENGVQAEIYEGAFDAIELEALDPSSGLYEFRPSVIVLATCTQALRSRYYGRQGADFLDLESRRIERIWETLQQNTLARIIQFNYPLPYERPFGNYGLKAPESLYAVTAALNSSIAATAGGRPNVLLCDVEAIASYHGRKHWFDERLWAMAKTFCQLDQLPYVAQNLVEITLSALGRVMKCVVLDLDNTIWGGVVGDDGPLGVSIGPHGDGESFYNFQQYLLSLKRRGILLAVCSKNDHENAVRPFLENPGMALKLDDIAAFVANWENKAENIRAIRDTLEIGYDSMVFLDDNPFERNLVREFLPEVLVPELPEDPADYVRSIGELNLFETGSFSREDAARTEFYRQETGRREQQKRFAGIDDYLQSLDMKIEVARFQPDAIPRIAQLIQRSNQFNLTTHRYNERECEEMMRNEEKFVPLFARLSDRFGDHGLISVVILHLDKAELEIRDWLMSCRVLARGVEQYLMARVAGVARDKGLPRMTGRYIPTAKNAMVKNFYLQFGFEKTGEEGGVSQWRIETAAFTPAKTFITESAGAS